MSIECHACVGGTNVREDMAKLQEGVHVVVGTPGRVFDMINRRAFRTDSIKIFCLDEADEMLSRGFKDQIYEGLLFIPHLYPALLLINSNSVPTSPTGYSSRFALCHHACWCVGGHQKIYAWPSPNSCQERRVDSWRYQAILYSGWEGGMETRHPLWSLRDRHHHPGCHLLQHQAEGRLVDWEDALPRIHCFSYG